MSSLNGDFNKLSLNNQDNSINETNVDNVDNTINNIDRLLLLNSQDFWNHINNMPVTVIHSNCHRWKCDSDPPPIFDLPDITLKKYNNNDRSSTSCVDGHINETVNNKNTNGDKNDDKSWLFSMASKFMYITK